MFEESIQLIEIADLGSISVCLYNENDEVFEIGERIHATYEEAYMNGYNWDALIRFFGKVDPDLVADFRTDPEAGMFTAVFDHSEENLEKAKRFEAHLHKLLADEAAIFKLIGENREQIEWD